MNCRRPYVSRQCHTIEYGSYGVKSSTHHRNSCRTPTQSSNSTDHKHTEKDREVYFTVPVVAIPLSTKFFIITSVHYLFCCFPTSEKKGGRWELRSLKA